MEYDYKTMTEALADLIAVDSVAGEAEEGYPYGRKTGEALDRALALCESFGFRTYNGDYRYGYAEIGEGDALIGILAHLDVVPAQDDWTHEPFAFTEEDGRLYGRGVTDDKGPAVACIYAMKDLLAQGIPKKRIRLIFGLAEEQGEFDDIKAYCEKEELPSCGFTPDGDFPVVREEKGAMLLRLRRPLQGSGFLRAEGGQALNIVAASAKAVLATGETLETEGIPAHGSCPEKGRNAITLLMEKGKDRAPFAAAYTECIGTKIDGSGFLPEEAQGRGLTVNAGCLETADGNLVLSLDLRVPAANHPEEVREALEARFRALDPEVTFELVFKTEPFAVPKDDPALLACMRAYREVTGDDSEALSIGGSTYAKAMPGIFAFGPSIPGHPVTRHEADEYILREDLEALRIIYLKALENLLAIQ